MRKIKHATGTRYAERLAVSLHEKHYHDNVNWKPLTGDIMGLLMQIDNMTAGLTRVLPPAASTGGEGMSRPRPSDGQFRAVEALIAASERQYLCDDEPDDSDISYPPSGITIGMIREARKELEDYRRTSRLLKQLNRVNKRAPAQEGE